MKVLTIQDVRRLEDLARVYSTLGHSATLTENRVGLVKLQDLLIEHMTSLIKEDKNG